MMLSVVLSIGLQLTDDTEISIRAKTRTNERRDENERKEGEIQQSKPDDFLRAV